ncbi:hypothetical protein C2800_11455 [Pasteurella multocida]|uniref:Uncharacterized protein n=1 Tax=Pasteurella multocida TaxID=747 RepID=A0A849CLY2_PASMD|nr:hypothetical protein [Pasteurella multocida]NNI49613.1 hypothetical protein [Pasteurella multocida]NNI58276.1 hypothetical protein [Pasteurella multocida]NNI60517.1 hypothetical protein [Pasteurella multocida]NNI80023.1 hypothetical protein [Pasteurella multocida]
MLDALHRWRTHSLVRWTSIREARKERGELRGSARFESEKGGREFAPGDRIVFLKNDNSRRIKNKII